MKQRIASLLIATMFASSCATAPPQKSTKKAANVKEWVMEHDRAQRNALVWGLVGAALSGGVTAVTGGSRENIVRNTLAGGVAGAVAGFAFGKHQDRVFAGRDVAVRQANYDQAQGYVARIDEVSFTPPNPKPGDKATLYVRYLVLGPNPNEAIRVRLFRGIKYGDDYIFGAGPNEFVIPQGGGVIESSVELTLPKKTPEGTYGIEAYIEEEKGRFPQVIGTNALYVVARVQQRGTAVAVR
jgi:hypothetical protein